MTIAPLLVALVLTQNTSRTRVCDGSGNCATITNKKLDVNASVSVPGMDPVLVQTVTPKFDAVWVTSTLGAGSAVSASQAGTWTVQPGNTANSTPWVVKIVDAAGADMDLFKPADLYTAANDHGILILGQDSGAPARYRPLLMNTSGAVRIDPVGTTTQPVNVGAINGVTPLMGNGATGTGSQRVTVASDNTPFAVKVDQTTPGTTNAVALAQVGSTTTVTGGVNGSMGVGGNTAHSSTWNNVNPVGLGAYAEADAAALDASGVAEADITRLKATLEGRLMVDTTHPFRFQCTRDAQTGSGVCANSATIGGNLHVTDIVLSNGGTAQNIKVTYGTGSTCGTGTTLIMPTTYFAVNGGAVWSSFTPFRVPTGNDVCCVISGSTAHSCTVRGFIGL